MVSLIVLLTTSRKQPERLSRAPVGTRLDFVLPNLDDLPPGSAQRPGDAPISLTIDYDFLHPKASVRSGQGPTTTTGTPVPKTTMGENGHSPS